MLDLTDVSGRLSRWRLCIQEFDFEVRYRKGAKHAFADAVLCLSTWGHSSVQPDLDITCPLVSDATAECSLHPHRHIDIASWTGADWDLGSDPVPADEATEPAEISAITVGDLRQYQARDAYCQSVRAKIKAEKTRDFVEDTRGLVVRIAPVDGAVQLLVPTELDRRSCSLPIIRRSPAILAPRSSIIQCAKPSPGRP